MSANPHANGGLLLQDLELPDFRQYAVAGRHARESSSVEPTRVLGTFLRDVIRANPTTFRIVGPDETLSNRLSAVFEATDRVWEAETLPGDEFLAPQGRVMEVLSEHLCEGWLEGYLLTGRHGIFNSYEAFIPIVDSMVNQHAKWLKTTREIPWRRPIASLNYLLVQPRLAPGPQRLLPSGSGFHRPRREQEARGRAGVPSAGRQHAPLGRRSLPAEPELRQPDRRRQAAGAQLPEHGRGHRPLHPGNRHLRVGELRPQKGCPTSCWPAPGTSRPSRRLAATAILRRHFPDLKVRVVNVVDLMRLAAGGRAPARPARRPVRRACSRPTGP